MTRFNEREKAFETEFAHREEMKFKVRERAIRLLALWAAQELRKTSQDGEAYARELVALDVANPNSDPVDHRISVDLMQAGITQQEIRRKMDQFWAEAKLAVGET